MVSAYNSYGKYGAKPPGKVCALAIRTPRAYSGSQNTARRSLKIQKAGACGPCAAGGRLVGVISTLHARPHPHLSSHLWKLKCWGTFYGKAVADDTSFPAAQDLALWLLACGHKNYRNLHKQIAAARRLKNFTNWMPAFGYKKVRKPHKQFANLDAASRCWSQ